MTKTMTLAIIGALSALGAASTLQANAPLGTKELCTEDTSEHSCEYTGCEAVCAHPFTNASTMKALDVCFCIS